MADKQKAFVCLPMCHKESSQQNTLLSCSERQEQALYSRMARLLTLLMGALLLGVAQCELFTAIAHMEGLLGLESELLTSLNSYITREKDRIQQLESFADQVSGIHNLMDEVDPTSHLHNPVNSLHLVGRFTNNWGNLADLVYQDNSHDLMANLSVNNYRLPTQEDFNGAMTAVMRLQDTYDLQPHELASGNLGKEKSLSMDALDCYRVGRLAYEEKNWKKARDWMKEALHKFEDGGDVDLVSIYDHLSFSEYSIGNLKRAAGYNKDLLQNEPNHERALSNMAYFNTLKDEKPDDFIDQEIPMNEDDRLEMSEREIYEATCREGRPYPTEIERKLTCFYYNGGNNPRLIIQPVKVEVVYLDPRIYILRGIVSDREIERLKELGGPVLNRATATNDAGVDVPVTYRISKSGWLSPADDDQGYLVKIDQRIEDFTGLTMETAEQLQVCNYGIGGHYEPHYDFARNDEDAFTSLGTGNRMATVLFYISAVERGGATVFTELGLRIAPSKGDATFWWNLKKSGEGDLRTRHAGCPVLVGSKWVCNKWIHERGQEFRRQCDLNKNL
ncbi:prolyl 4-hydroxylase subunit alpha-1-like isoform X2 [Halichondria panicea]|uniref:prolyl 4-hydroxylase subunit alpha-1-like isoform X2 n=1 Tax=Halichondria panicea TaxID=6063 RepID=UPI00312B6A85